MKREYYLYLDESEDEEKNLLTMAGVIINVADISALEEELFQIKKLLWEEGYVKKYHPILHSNELNFMKKNAANPDRAKLAKGAYHNLAKRSTEEINKGYLRVYHRLTQVIKNESLTILSCTIHRNQMLELFPFYDKSVCKLYMSDCYDIALQVMIENFCHYLIQVDGVGSIIYEARSSGQLSEHSSDVKMQDNFCKIKSAAKGITYLNETAIRKYIRDLMIVDKQYNSAGLQLADFVAFNFVKMNKITREDEKTAFMKQLYRYAYNGGYCLLQKDVRQFYGLRSLPYDIELFQHLNSQNEKLKHRIEHLKTEKLRLNRKLNQEREKKNGGYHNDHEV